MARRGIGDPNFEIYLQQIREFPLLSAEEERAVARLVQSPDWDAWEARDKLIRSNLRLVISVAKRYRNRGLTIADLVEEGNVGLVHAVEKFDPEMEVRFSTYATWWIRQAMRRAILNTVKTVRVPAYMAEEVNRWRVFAHRFAQAEGREPTREELLAEMEPAPTRRKFLIRLYDAMREGNDAVSLDVLFDGVDTLVDPRAERPDRIDFLSTDREKLQEVLKGIPERERKIIELRYGLANVEHAMTLRQIAEVVGISRERVRQLEHKALETLRRKLGGGIPPPSS